MHSDKNNNRLGYRKKTLLQIISSKNLSSFNDNLNRYIDSRSPMHPIRQRNENNNINDNSAIINYHPLNNDKNEDEKDSFLK